MSFEKVPIPNFDNLPIPFDDPVKYPQPKKTSGLPKNFFTNLTIGSTGSGKSFSVCKLLKYYEKNKYYDENNKIVPQRIIIFAPTFESNPIYLSLKNLDAENDVYTTYSDALLQEVLDDIDAVKKECMRYEIVKKAMKQFRDGVNVDTMDPEAVILLMTYNYDIRNVPEPRYSRAPVNHIIFDDLVCQAGAYKTQGSSLLSNLSVRNRHKQANLYFLAQAVKQIPKVIRTQARLLMIYRYNSTSIVSDLFEIVSGVLKPDQFEKIYKDVTEEKYNFLTIDNTQGDILIKQNFNMLIKLKNDKIEIKKIENKKS